MLSEKITRRDNAVFFEGVTAEIDVAAARGIRRVFLEVCCSLSVQRSHLKDREFEQYIDDFAYFSETQKLELREINKQVKLLIMINHTLISRAHLSEAQKLKEIRSLIGQSQRSFACFDDWLTDIFKEHDRRQEPYSWEFLREVRMMIMRRP